MRRHIALVFIVFFWLSACTTLPDGPQQAVDLPIQLAKLNDINQWQIKGKMAIRQGKKAVSANMNWKTNQADFKFRLTNLLGITLVNMDYSQGLAVLEADDKTYEHSDPSALIYEVTNWDIPVHKLLSWIKGLPLKDDVYQLNDKQLLASLSPNCETCSSWQVSYSQYGNVEGIWLPYQLTLRQTDKDNTMIKIRIDSWELADEPR
ncbi:lipoprotein insertase outer membrane protein LolB [Alteromonas sp. C1M14]|uniref:lipoprotein insertase outer membrane protein LolB n=1 Tax=Alteromonas sp. C1M14 TaxID=2841567 RepID=UPI001C081580|nr:lipoprotein insertase outer membrane protein LolB [Alteromonas sp. C1M14]MBU2978875.1 lipoprotein insertase outer membrane protein LolB [Alteromonas sp. C1M14]